MLIDIVQRTKTKLHPLLLSRTVKKMVLILVSSNRGLAGGFNSKIIQKTDNYLKKTKEMFPKLVVDIILLGKRGRKIYSYFKHPITAEFEKMELTTKPTEILSLARMVTLDYIKKKNDKVVMVYTDYISALKQVPRVKQILPLEEEDKFLGKTFQSTGQKREKTQKIPWNYEFKFEPNPELVLNMLLPRLVEMQIYQAILESDASEHSARMMAMRNATEAADEMIKELDYNFNKARQAAITKEISEIIGGADAL
jgi:F-type H+-transporting ATPase subunit gamma